MHKKTKYLAIPRSVKEAVFERDNGRCVYCGKAGLPEAHYIPRSRMGLGIEENILTLCRECHRLYDGEKRAWMRPFLKAYLQTCYPDWDEYKLIYRKGDY